MVVLVKFIVTDCGVIGPIAEVKAACKAQACGHAMLITCVTLSAHSIEPAVENALKTCFTVKMPQVA
jgi:hypothetical protein